MEEINVIGHIINGFKRAIRELLINKKIVSIEKMIEHAKKNRVV